MRFKDYYLNEDLVFPDRENKTEHFLQIKRDVDSLDLFNKDIIWRSFNIGKGAQPTVEVINDRKEVEGDIVFRGSYLVGNNQLAADIVRKKFQIKKPAFATYEFSTFSVFGNPGVMVPVKPFKAYVSPISHDIAILSDKSPKELNMGDSTTPIKDIENEEEYNDVLNKIQSTYKTYDNEVPARGGDEEIIFDIPKYWMIFPKTILFFTNRSKFAKIRDIKELKTYKDVITMLNDYTSYYNYTKKRREEL